MEHVALTALEAGLDHIRNSPKDSGTIELIVSRPTVDEREVLAEAVLDVADGLVGDRWRAPDGSHGADGRPYRGTQLTLMNARVAALVASDPDRWQLAGDQLFVDLDLSKRNLPPGTRLAAGSALIEITDEPHTGCGKFAARFGVDAQRFINSQTGRELNLRGVNAMVITAGVVRRGDTIAPRGRPR
jgi:hypothetical protein